MKYTEKMLAKLPTKQGFRLRGLDMTRLETFLDAAFAFATTMLVISVSKLPETYSELILALKGIPAFAASFAIMMFFWISHRKWSRYYGLEDGISVFFSLLLIFVLLVYIYPLKLMFSAMFSWISNGWFPSEFVLHTTSELIGLYIIYGLGVATMAALMVLLYWHAKRAREELKLNQLEMILTKGEIAVWFTMSITGLTSALFALIMPLSLAVFAGFFYMSLTVSMPVVSTRYERKAKNLRAALQDKKKSEK